MTHKYLHNVTLKSGQTRLHHQWSQHIFVLFSANGEIELYLQRNLGKHQGDPAVK
jgi:hypothetical protein